MVIPRHHIVMGINLLSPSIYSVPVIRAVYSCVIIASTRCSFLEMRHSVSGEGVDLSILRSSIGYGVVGLRLKFVRFKLERNIFQLIRAIRFLILSWSVRIFSIILEEKSPRKEIWKGRKDKFIIVPINVSILNRHSSRIYTDLIIHPIIISNNRSSACKICKFVNLQIP